MSDKASLFTITPDDVTDDLILRRCKNFRDAIRLCRDCSPLTDKEIVDEFEKRGGKKMQRPHFVDALNGGIHNVPPENIPLLEDICENWIPTRYMALSRNQELRPKKEAWELENERLKALLTEKENELDVIRKWENGKKK